MVVHQCEGLVGSKEAPTRNAIVKVKAVPSYVAVIFFDSGHREELVVTSEALTAQSTNVSCNSYDSYFCSSYLGDLSP